MGPHAEHATAFTFLSFLVVCLVFFNLPRVVSYCNVLFWFFFLHLPRLHSQYSRFQFDIWADALTPPVPSPLIFNPPPRSPRSRPSHLKCSGSETNSFQRPPKAPRRPPPVLGSPLRCQPRPRERCPVHGLGLPPAAAFPARKSGKVFLLSTVLPVFSHR